jgi:hypothetical protein
MEKNEVSGLSLVHSACGKVNHNLRQYFNEKGEYIPKIYWFDAVRWEKRPIFGRMFIVALIVRMGLAFYGVK